MRVSQTLVTDEDSEAKRGYIFNIETQICEKGPGPKSLSFITTTISYAVLDPNPGVWQVL
jgi:hypothetical protein